MSLEKLEEKLSNLSKETKSLYNKIDEKYRIAINGEGAIELVDISSFKVLARGEKKIQEAIKNFLWELDDGSFFSWSEAIRKYSSKYLDY